MNTENNNKLTEQDVELISKTLEESVSENTKQLREIMKESDNDDKAYPYNVMNIKVKKELVNMQVNQHTGETTIESILDSDEDIDNLSIDDVILSGGDILSLSEISTERMVDSLVEMDMSDEEAYKIVDILRRFENGEEITYEELPKYLVRMVDSLQGYSSEGGSKFSKKTVINDVLKLLKSQLQMDNEIIEFQDVLQKELKIPEFINMYTKETDELMYTKLNELAEEREKNGQLDKAKELRSIADNYDDAKNFKTLKELVDAEDKLTKRLDREVVRFKKHVRDFEYKYQNGTSFKIDGLRLVLNVLKRHTKLSEEQCIKFLVFFCRVCQNKSPKVVSEHTYMYYTLKTITILDAFTKTEDVYYKSIVETLQYIINKL